MYYIVNNQGVASFIKNIDISFVKFFYFETVFQDINSIQYYSETSAIICHLGREIKLTLFITNENSLTSGLVFTKLF
jgi:hypothetical protein